MGLKITDTVLTYWRLHQLRTAAMCRVRLLNTTYSVVNITTKR